MGRLVTRSSLPAERALQSWGLAVFGWLALSVLVFGGVVIAGAVESGDAGSTVAADQEPIGHEMLRGGLGAIHLVLCLVLPVLVRRHLSAIRSIRGLKSQYRNAPLGVAVVSVPCFLFLWYGGPVAAVLMGGVALWVSTIRVLPAHAMAGEVETHIFPTVAPDDREPSAWAMWQTGHPVLYVLLILLVPLLLLAVVIGVGLLLV